MISMKKCLDKVVEQLLLLLPTMLKHKSFVCFGVLGTNFQLMLPW